MLQYLKDIYEFFMTGIFGFVTDVIAYVLAGWIYFKLIILVGWIKAYIGVALWFIDFIGLGVYMQNFVNQFDSKLSQLMSYLGVFDGIVIVLSARLSTFMFRILHK